MTRETDALPGLEQLWAEAPAASGRLFDPAMARDLPEPARRYLTHTITPGTPLARSVHLHMRGEIFLNKWLEFEAEQVIVWDRGLIWRARVDQGLLTIKGFDRIVDGVGEMRWRLLGLIPVLTATGPDITRSAKGRHEIESVLIPSVFVGDATRWSSSDHDHADVSVRHGDQEGQVHLSLDDTGGLRSAWLERWGNPDGGDFSEVPFGVVAVEEGRFGGYTIPSKIRVGWHYREGGFDEDGEFFRAELTAVEYR